MIGALKKRPRPDNLKSDQRKVTNGSGRLIYLGSLMILCLIGLDYLFGDMIFLRADGFVLRDKSSISASYLASVKKVHVTGGLHVRKGTPLLKLQSFGVLERLAELSSINARLIVTQSQNEIRSKTVRKLLPLARKRASEAASALDQFDQLLGPRIVSTASYNNALLTKFEAQRQLVQYEAEDQAFKEQMTSVKAAITDAQAALTDLRNHYGDGVVRAPVDGNIEATIPSIGDAFQPGQTILSIYSGNSYVLAYLPRRYLFSIKTGTKVKMESGRWSATGHISEILPMTAALPEEFQNNFRPRDRNQLARIHFDSKAPFPLHEKVRVTRAGLFF